MRIAAGAFLALVAGLAGGAEPPAEVVDAAAELFAEAGVEAGVADALRDGLGPADGGGWIASHDSGGEIVACALADAPQRAEVLAAAECFARTAVRLHRGRGLEDSAAMRAALAAAEPRRFEVPEVPSSATHRSAHLGELHASLVRVSDADARRLATRLPGIEDLRPPYARAMHERARALIAAEDHEGALVALKIAMKLGHHVPSVRLDAARCFLHLGHPDDAETLAVDVWERQSGDFDLAAAEACGDLMQELGKPTLAEAAYLRAIALAAEEW